jgi:hypothetical protein
LDRRFGIRHREEAPGLPNVGAEAMTTHRLLAQRVTLIRSEPEGCTVEYQDGSRGTVQRCEMVSEGAIVTDRDGPLVNPWRLAKAWGRLTWRWITS